MAQLSSVVVQTYDEQGAELLDYHTFSLPAGVASAFDGSAPLTHSFRRLRDKSASVRVLALGRGVVDGVERTLVEAQKKTTIASGATRQLELFFSGDCFQRFCRTELRSSSLTCARGGCVDIPFDEGAPPGDGMLPPDGASSPSIDAGFAGDVATDGGPSASMGLDASDKPDSSSLDNGAGCTLGAEGCACAGGTLPPCNVAPPIDSGPTCDVGKYVGAFTGAVGTDMSAPNTGVSGTISFEVPAPSAGTVAIVGSLNGKTPAGHTIVARVDGHWNCALRSIEQGRLLDGVYTYTDRFFANTDSFTGTVTGSYGPGSAAVEGNWTVDSVNNAGGSGTWSAAR